FSLLVPLNDFDDSSLAVFYGFFCATLAVGVVRFGGRLSTVFVDTGLLRQRAQIENEFAGDERNKSECNKHEQQNGTGSFHRDLLQLPQTGKTQLMCAEFEQNSERNRNWFWSNRAVKPLDAAHNII